jgi:hypothetical protein
LAVEGGEAGLDGSVDPFGPVFARGSENFAEGEPAQAGGGGVFRRDAGQAAEVHALAGVELGGNKAGAERPQADAGASSWCKACALATMYASAPT